MGSSKSKVSREVIRSYLLEKLYFSPSLAGFEILTTACYLALEKKSMLGIGKIELLYNEVIEYYKNSDTPWSYMKIRKNIEASIKQWWTNPRNENPLKEILYKIYGGRKPTAREFLIIFCEHFK